MKNIIVNDTIKLNIMKLKSFDYYLTFLMMMVAIYSGYHLFLKKHQFKISKNRETVAHIENRTNIVKQKNLGFLSWLDTSNGSSLANGDQIYTHKNSSTKINFLDNSSINVYEESLLVINSLQNNIDLDIKKGLIEASFSKEKSSLIINMDGIKIRAESRDAKIILSKKDGKSELTVFKGSLKIRQGNSVKTVKKNQVLKMDKKSRKNRIEKLLVIPKWPKPGAILWYKDNTVIRFATKNIINSGQLEISKDYSFSRLEFSGEFYENNLSVENLKEGSYFWRVTSPELESSPIFPFTLIKEKAPLLNFPSHIYWIDNKNSVIVNWSNLTTRNGHLTLQQADQVYKFPIKNRRGQKAITLNTPTKGQIWIEQDRKERKTSLNSIKKPLHIIIPKKLSPPKILSPEKNKTFGFYDLSKASLNLSWNKIQNAEDYTVQIKNKKGNLITKKTIRSNIKIKMNPNYARFRVRANSKIRNHHSLYSDWRNIEIKRFKHHTFIPGKGVKIVLNRPGDKVNFKWDTTSKSRNNYLFEASSDSQFENILVQKKSRHSNTTVIFKRAGVIFWRTKIVSPNGDFIYTPPIKIEVVPSPLPSPPILDPLKKIKLKRRKSSFHWIDIFFSKAYAGDEGIVTLEWQKSDSAKKYIIEIFSDKDLQQKILRKEVDEAFFDWKYAISGVFYWRIAIIDHWDRQTEFSNTSQLEIEDFEPVVDEIRTPTITLKTPFHKDMISQNKSVLFKWSKDDHYKSYTLLFSKDLSFNSPLRAFTTKNNQYRVKRDLFPKNGQFFWKVLGETEENITHSSRRRSLIIIGSPLIHRPPKERKKRRRRRRKITSYKKKLSYFYSPEKVSYQQKTSQFDLNIDGTAINSHYFSYEHHLRRKKKLLFTGLIQRGKVFTNLSYQHYAIGSEYLNLLKYKKFALHLGLNIRSISEYSEVNEKLTESQLLLISTGISISRLWQFRRWNHQVIIKAESGNALYLVGAIQTNYLWKKNRILSLKTNYKNLSFDGKSGENTMTGLNLGIGLTYLF